MDIDSGLNDIFQWLKNRLGFSIDDKLLVKITHRINTVKNKYKFESYQDLFDKLSKDKDDDFREFFIHQLVTNYTFFFREIEVLSYIQNNILRKEYQGKAIKVWCAACSTGEEAYSLSMMCEKNKGFIGEASILATDIDKPSLLKAQKGQYDKNDYYSIPQEYQNENVKIVNEDLIISEHIKKRILFKKLNLISNSWPIKNKMDLIFCRNVLYYFTKEAKKKILDKFYDVLKDGAYLIISVSDNHTIDTKKFVKISNGIFKKI